MSSDYQPLPSITPTFPQSASAIAFDPVSDILWAGTSLGAVTGYYGSRGLRGVSFPVSGSRGPVSKIVANDNQVFAASLGDEGVGSWHKGGMNKWFYKYVADSRPPFAAYNDRKIDPQRPPSLHSAP